MRWIPALRICVAASLLGGSAAHAANDSIRIGDWILRPHFSEQKDKKQKEKRLDRCTAQLTNADKITMIYSLDTHYMWTLELSNPSWNFPSGSKFDVSFGNRERGYFRQRVAALDPQLVRVLLPDSLNSFEAFRRVFKLDVVAGGLTTQFDLAYANQVLLALTQCVTKFGMTTKSKAAITAYLKSPIGPAAEANSDPAIVQEAFSLAGAIVAQFATQKIELLKLAAIAIVGMPLPIWLLSIAMPWAAAAVVVGAFAFFAPLVNAPIIGVLTVRTPAALRPKVMTAVMTVATLAGPLGFVAASQAISRVSIYTVFFVIAAVLNVGAVAFAAVLLRNRAAPDLVAMPDIAHG